MRHTPLGDLKQIFYQEALAKNFLNTDQSPKQGYFISIDDTDLVIPDRTTGTLDDFLCPELEEPTEVRILLSCRPFSRSLV